MAIAPLLLVTGATGKVGAHVIARLLASPDLDGWRVRALAHHRTPAPHPRVETVRGTVADRAVARAAVQGATHVLHLATCKETPEDAMDVAVKGLFWLLEEFRASASAERFILLGGDAAVGHSTYPHPVPVTETQRHTAYAGCYALSKVLEEAMLAQYLVQYGLDACCLRAPWIMEKDDFRSAHTFAADVFGKPVWRELVGSAHAAELVRAGAFPLALSRAGEAIKRNFVHLDDLASAILTSLTHPRAARETFNICMDEPVDYRAAAEHLARAHGVPACEVRCELHPVWLDNAKARFLLGWRPRYDLARLIDDAWAYARSPADPRRIWYPG